MTTSILFGLAILATASAAPWPSRTQLCSRECPVAGSPKLFYEPEKTYVYSYTGKSRINLKDVEGANADMEWNSQVELSWLSPCDMAIVMKSPSIGGGSGSAEARFLERYPLVVSIIDGRVQESCAHPDDDVWSINMKKGIASAFQNTLPSNSSINSGLNFTETDIVGNCSTMYEVDNQGEKVIVTKLKNHRFCQDHYANRAETPKAWLKAPLPMEESFSECKQEITKGIYSSITCKDKNIIRPAYGSYKYVEANQESVLRFQSVNDQVPAPISHLPSHFIRKTLRYDQHTLKKDPSMVAKVDEMLKQVCEKTKLAVQEDAASHFAKALHFLRRVPEEAIPQTLEKIRGGQICEHRQKLESMFLDGLAFVYESGAVKVMVQELLSGKAKEGRAALYAASMYFMPRPCIRSIEALKPLFENYQRFPRTTLAAASMVNSYCRQNPNCQEKPPVRQLAETLSRKVAEMCTPTENEEARQKALVLLKALGNMGVMNSEIARPILQCIENTQVDNSIRLVATQSFRNVHCHHEFHQITRKLVDVAIDPRKGTEARIGSYLAAMKCAKYEDIRNIVEKISEEENTQVKSFILSHLLNVQESTASYKGELRYNLESIVLPSNFTKDWRKYSRNIDLSYYAPTFGAGAGMESNLIYAPGSYIPRSVNLNLTAALGATPFNIGEIGARIEGMESVLEKVFGPESYLRRTPTRQILEDFSSKLGEKVNKINERLQSSLRLRRSIDLSEISHLFDKLYGDRRSHLQKADFYARINNQEMAFGSLAGNLNNINVDELINNLFDNFDEMINKASTMHMDPLRAAQIYLDYHLPTMQGVPIKMKLEGTAVVGMKMETQVSGLMSGTPGVVKVFPSLSTQIDAFIGYDCHIARAGIKTKNLIATNYGASINAKITPGQGFELELEIPEKMELVKAKSETYLMKQMKDREETKVNPSSVRTTRFQSKSCSMKMEPMLGLKVCYDVNMPNIFRSEGLPLGPQAEIKLLLEKSESSMKGFRVKGRQENTGGKKMLKVELETPGSSSPRKAAAILSSVNEGEAMKYSATFESERLGGIRINMIRKWTQSEKQLELSAYFSKSRQYNAGTKGVEAKFFMNSEGEDVKLDMALKTMEAVREYVEINFEVNGDLKYIEGIWMPLPRRLNKFEGNVAFRHWHLLSSIRKESESQYKSAMKFGQKGNEVVDMTATHAMEGSSIRNMVFKTDLEAKIGNNRYKNVFAAYNQESKKGVELKVVSQEDRTHVIDMEMVLVYSGESSQFKFLVDIPSLFRKVMIDISAASQGSSQYQIKTVAKHGENTVFLMEGPLSAIISSKNGQFKTDMKVVFLRSEPYTVSTSLVLIPGKHAFTFDIKKREERLMVTEWNMVTRDEKETHVEFKMNFASIIEKKINVVVTNELLHLSFDQLISPKNSPIRMKGMLDIDFKNKKAMTELHWDAERDPNKKIKVEVKLANPLSTLRDCVLLGSWRYIDKQYKFKTELKLQDPSTWFIGRNSLMLELTNPSQKMYKVNSMLTIESETSGPKLRAEITFRTPENKEYKWNSESALEWREGIRNMRAMTKADIVSPEGQLSRMNLEVKHHWTPSQREASLMIEVSSPSLSRPIKTRLELNNQQSEYSTKWVIELGSPVNGAMYKLRVSPEGGVQSFEVEFDLKKVTELLKSIEHLVSSGSSSMISSSSSSALYRAHFKNHERNSISMLLMSPSRTMESECKCNECTGTPCTDCHCRFIPHKGVSDSKYEVAVRQSHSDWNKESRFEVLFSHPGLKRDRRIDIQIRRDEQKITGTVELDIFQKSDDKITGKLMSTIFARNTVIVEALLTGKVLKVEPRVIVGAAYGPSNYGFDIKFHKSHTSPVSFLISGKVDLRSVRNVAISLIIENENRKSTDISLSLRPHLGPYCYGVRAEGRAMASPIGTYDITSELCKPAFAAMTTKKHGSDNMYVTRIGLQGMKNAEVSISEANPETMEKRPLGMVRLRLTSPSMMKLDTKYESEKLHEIKSTLRDMWSRLISAAGNWMDSMSNEVLKEGSGSPSAQMSHLWQEMKNEASRIYSDLQDDLVIPRYEKIKEWARNSVVSDIADRYSKVWSQYAHLQNSLSSFVSKMIKNLQEEFSDLTKLVVEVVMGTARGLKTGEMPERIQRWWSQFQESSLYRDVESKLDSAWSDYREEYEGLKQILRKVKSTLAKDVDKQRRNLMQLKKPREVINWIVNHLNFDRMVFKNMDKWAKNIVQNALFLSVQMEGNHFQLQLPIRQPVHSLPQALSYVSLNPVPAVDTTLWWYEALMPTSVDNLVWNYNTFLPRHARYLVPPYNRTAMIVDGTEILTFDGAVLRVPHSSCKVLLAQYKTHSLIMQSQKSSPSPHFVLKVAEGTVEVKPDFTITLNGRPVSGPQEVHGEVQIIKENHKIKVMSPYITLRVYRNSHVASVEVSGWTFGKVAGILGTYDGEMGNDWMTPQGSRASSLQELVKSWQEDRQCETPQVSPLKLLQVPVAHMLKCQALFGIRSRCNPVVRQEPFRKMCFASRNACHVVKAYSAICETKGFKDLFYLGC